MMIDLLKLGDAIRQVRKKREFTQLTLAEHSGVTSNTIARIERGELQCTIATLNAIAEALGVPSSFLTIMGTESSGHGAKGKLLKTLQKSVLAVVEAEQEHR